MAVGHILQVLWLTDSVNSGRREGWKQHRDRQMRIHEKKECRAPGETDSLRQADKALLLRECTQI